MQSENVTNTGLVFLFTHYIYSNLIYEEERTIALWQFLLSATKVLPADPI